VTASLVPQLLVNCVLLTAALVYVPRAWRLQRNRVLVVVFCLLGAFGVWANVRGYALQGFFQGFRMDRV